MIKVVFAWQVFNLEAMLLVKADRLLPWLQVNRILLICFKVRRQLLHVAIDKQEV